MEVSLANAAARQKKQRTSWCVSIWNVLLSVFYLRCVSVQQWRKLRSEHDLISKKLPSLSNICSPITSELCIGCNQGPWLMVMKIIKVCACHQHTVCCINQCLIGDEGNCLSIVVCVLVKAGSMHCTVGGRKHLLHLQIAAWKTQTYIYWCSLSPALSPLPNTPSFYH